MPILEAIVLGIVQGLAEFLPISSSGHLILVPWLFGWESLADNPDLNRSFDVALHVGTFAGAFAYFRKDIARIVVGVLSSIRHRRIETDQQRLAWLLVIASLPAATIGFVLDSVLNVDRASPWSIAVMLIVFGVVLALADRLRGARSIETFDVRSALLMGFAQAAALQPGVSRSGATISMGRFLRFDRDAAVRISFLMSLPITAGAGLYKGLDVLTEGGVPADFVPAFIWGMVTAAITGWVAVWGTLRLIRTRSFMPFVV
ncbi:MAG: undecaprenyl-diphosphate phosphatase, partial [Acidimicrobiia bacterium]